MKSYLKFLSRNKLYATVEAAMIAAVSVLWQVLYSARSNPAVELKKE